MDFSFSKNVTANYISQAYVALINIIMLPILVNYMGAEAFGLVGFFTVIQAWSNMLDVGLTATTARETARFVGGASSRHGYMEIIAAMEGLFCVLGFIILGILFLASGYLGEGWFSTSRISSEELKYSFYIISGIVALRWVSGLYRGVIVGNQRFIMLSLFNIFIASARFIFVLPVLIFIDSNPSTFFSYQFFVAIVEFLVLFLYANKLLPDKKTIQFLRFNWAPIVPSLKFSISIAFGTISWVLVTQLDKLLLSKLLSLEAYGYFTLAVVAASGVMLISAPISLAIMPRMTKLDAEGKEADLVLIYRMCSQIVALFVGSIAITVLLHSREIIYAWSGSIEISERISDIFLLYTIGNCFMALSSFSYYLQYAKGNLKLHVLGNILLIIVLIPVLVKSVLTYGAIGAGFAWMGINLLFLIAWVPMVHSKFIPSLNKNWFSYDLGIVIFSCIAGGYFVNAIIPVFEGRWHSLLGVAITGFSSLVVGLCFSKHLRPLIKKLLPSKRMV